MENLPYLFVAYMVIWLGIFAYAYSLSLRQKELRREVEHLKELLRSQEARAKPE